MQFDGVQTDSVNDVAGLAEWLSGANPAHPLVASVGSNEWFAKPIDEMIKGLYTNGVGGLSSRRKSFVSDAEHFLDNRAELNVAYCLSRSCSRVWFGREGGNSPSEPDVYCISEGGVEFCVEVTTKSPEGIGNLHDELEAALVGRDVHVVLNVASILRLSPAQRAEAVQLVVQAADRPKPPVVNVSLPMAGGSAQISWHSEWGGPSVVWQHDFSQSAISECEEIFYEAVTKKSEQARMGAWPPNTLLVVDVSRIGNVMWLRGDELWARRLHGMSAGWNELPFLGVAMILSTLTSVGYRGAIAPRRNLSHIEVAVFTEAVSVLGVGLACRNREAADPSFPE